MEAEAARIRILTHDYVAVQRRIKDIIAEESVLTRETMENLICNGY